MSYSPAATNMLAVSIVLQWVAIFNIRVLSAHTRLAVQTCTNGLTDGQIRRKYIIMYVVDCLIFCRGDFCFPYETLLDLLDFLGNWVFYYSDGQKSCTFFLEFSCGSPGGGGPMLELVDFVKWSSPFHKIDQFQNWSHSPRGPRKKSRKNVQDFCPSLY